MSPRLFVVMMDKKREIDLAKIKRLAFQTAGAVWGKDIYEDSSVSSSYDPFDNI